MMERRKYFLDQDSSCHWYIVPLDRQSEWYDWCAIPDEDERAWDAPDFAISVGGSPSLVSFECPRIGGTLASQ